MPKWNGYANTTYASVWSLRSDRLQELQYGAKMCAPVLKCHQLKGLRPFDPLPGALPTFLLLQLQTTCDARGQGCFLQPILYCVARKFRHLQNYVQELVTNRRLRTSVHSASIVARCCQLSPIKVEAWRDKLARRRSTKLTILATVDG